MTRASLLYILDHVSGISEAEIRELEQLATAFPYCQTAHILLAKAAHDRGSMLASQRLRRAATYAADRQLLRQLLEQPVQEPALLAASPPRHLLDSPDKQAEIAVLTSAGTTAFYQTLGAEDVQPLEPAPASEPAPVPPSAALAEAEVLAAPGTEPVFSAAVATTDPTPATAAELASTEEALYHVSIPETAGPAEADAAIAEDTAGAHAPAETPPAAGSSSDVAAAEAVIGPADTRASLSAPPVGAAPLAELPAQVPATNTSTGEPDEPMPAVAPPIRPPAEVGTSRFEFGLNTPATPALSSLYQLPGAEADSDEALPPLTPASMPPFRGDARLAYALLGGGSRLGYALQSQDGELTSALPGDEFFAPDALLQAHAAEHRPASPPAPSSLDLINRFLQNQPRLKSPAVRLSLAEEQTDLSVRSTSVKPDIASESLAKIMIRQGKVDKAIEIYERLMVRQPEKSAYFADQIQQLQTPE